MQPLSELTAYPPDSLKMPVVGIKAVSRAESQMIFMCPRFIHRTLAREWNCFLVSDHLQLQLSAWILLVWLILTKVKMQLRELGLPGTRLTFQQIKGEIEGLLLSACTHTYAHAELTLGERHNKEIGEWGDDVVECNSRVAGGGGLFPTGQRDRKTVRLDPP